MNARATVVQGALAAAGLAAAYLTWQRPAQSESAGAVTVVAATKAALERVRYERKDQWLELVRDASGAAPQFWIERGLPPPSAPAQAAAPDSGIADGGAAAAAHPAPTPAPSKLKPGQYKASERAAKLHERMAPLTALRSLGRISAEKRKELGLESSDRRLELQVSGMRRSFKVAQSEGGGAYLWEEGDGQVYLVGGGLLSDLDAADVLIDRRLHAFDRAEVDAFSVAAGGKAKSFVQKTGENERVPGAVAPREKPDQPDEQVRNWHQKIWARLSAAQVLPKGELPGGAEPETALRIDYSRRGRAIGWLEISKSKSGDYYARSEHTASWVQVSGADELVAEGARVVGD